MDGMPLDNLISGFSINSVWGIAKGFYLLGIGIYLIFAMVMIRQVQLMSNTLNGTLNLPLRLVAWIHLGLGVGVFLLALAAL